MDDPTLSHPHRLATTLERGLREVETAFARAWWDSQTDAGPETERRRAEIELELRRVKGDPEAHAAVTEALRSEIHDPILKRQLEVLRLSLTANQMDETQREELVALASSVESDFAAFRPVVDGERLSDNDIEEVLKDSNDEAQRRKVWEASKEVGGLVSDRVRELARLRNDIALNLGYADYYRMALDMQELNEAWLFSIMDELESLTDEPFRRWKAELDVRLAARFGTEELYPWHYADPFFQSLPPDGRIDLDPVFGDADAAALAKETFGRWAIDISDVIARSDLSPRERKSQHAFCVDIDRSGRDVRILANVVPGERWIEVMLHESGHAAYDVAIDPHLPYLLHRPTHTFTTEAVALLSGRLGRDPKWLVDIAGIPHGDVAPIENELRHATAAQELVFARWGLVMVHFERELYADPEADLDALWWELVERFQGVAPPPDRSAPDWAAKVHVATAPVYYQNYLLGDLLASQLLATCEERFGGLVGVEDAGRLLSERLMRPGASLRWDALVQHATDRPLSAKDFAETSRL